MMSKNNSKWCLTTIKFKDSRSNYNKTAMKLSFYYRKNIIIGLTNPSKEILHIEDNFLT